MDGAESEGQRAEKARVFLVPAVGGCWTVLSR